MVKAPFIVRFRDIVQDLDLRMDEKFHRKLSESGFDIVSNSVYPYRRLSEILVESREKFRYRKGEVYGGVSTDSSMFTIEGEILGTEEVTLEDHPNRIEMAVRVNDIIISRLRGARSPVILAGGDLQDFVWSNGFLILRPLGDKFSVKFLYYVLRSSSFRKILDEHLSRGIGISSYYPRDILRLKIPAVPREIQEKTVEEAEKIDSKIKEIRISIPDIPRLIDEVFMEEMEWENGRIRENHNNSIYLANFSDIGRKKNLRCDVKYTTFFGGMKTGADYVSVKSSPLGDALEPVHLPVIRKGYLKQKMILINKEDVLPKSGTVISREYVDRIDSDKVLLDDADLLVSKIDPFLGHFIRNPKDEPMIGTSEFMGFRVKEGHDEDYIHYSMLSEAFLDSTKSLISGKRQPRINLYDILSIKVPMPSLERQIQISSRISKKRGDLQEKGRVMEVLRRELDKRIHSALAGRSKGQLTD